MARRRVMVKLLAHALAEHLLTAASYQVVVEVKVQLELEEVNTLNAEALEMSVHQGTLLCLGVLLMTAGGVMAFGAGIHHPPGLLFGLGLLLGLGGIGLLVSGLCMAMKNLQIAVPGHFLLHPRTGTRFSPQQALAIQRRLDRIRREMSADSVSRSPEPEPTMPSTPPPWTMEPPPSYDTVMKSQECCEQL